MAKTSYDKVKKGLGMICFGIVISFIMGLIYAIVQAIKKDAVPSGWATANSIVSLISVIAVALGILICFFSGQKYFRKALIIYAILIVAMVVLAALNEKLADYKWVVAIYYALLAIAHMFVITALKDVSSNKSKLNSIILSLCILLFITIIVFIILGATITLKFNYVALIYSLATIEDVLFFIAIFTTYLAIK